MNTPPQEVTYARGYTIERVVPPEEVTESDEVVGVVVKRKVYNFDELAGSDKIVGALEAISVTKSTLKFPPGVSKITRVTQPDGTFTQRSE